ncbi:YjeF domain-containing protein [Nadsonia fulvescens var. elongata DSM 6958]|uniref:ATP-dependent (S)-NAD(P)H-hydrate dehydratase n=1 Tax=Nadsonia fulvescens var. elongata DSM 6958 TaxID=857566 RepID=A0A1E3PMI0_9ASCO|nr:YjeF domain-containing protein [Nadsonia fulvescens var. elongata DSM 6958]
MSRLGKLTSKETLKLVQSMVPPLKPSFHKGQAGRIAVIGGCEDYTGAPYFSAMAATVFGADMSHIVCAYEAATVIKSYSPDLMVHPYLHETASQQRAGVSESEIVERAKTIVDRVHALVVGPGMGRDKLMLSTVTEILKYAISQDMPMVIDADGLFLVQQDPKLIRGYKRAILTPNKVEFERLVKASGLESGSSIKQLSEALGGVLVVQKGMVDLVSDGTVTIEAKYEGIQGGLKRVGGQGDTMSGIMVTLLAWSEAYRNKLWEHGEHQLSDSELLLLSAWGACLATKYTSQLAFESKGRAMVTSDLQGFIGRVYNELFSVEKS